MCKYVDELTKMKSGLALLCSSVLWILIVTSPSELHLEDTVLAIIIILYSTLFSFQLTSTSQVAPDGFDCNL